MNNILRNDLCKLQSISYEISYNNINKPLNIDAGNVLDCQVTWDVNDISVMGQLIFKDTGDFFTLTPPHSSMLLTIKYKQYLSPTNSEKVYDFERTFAITRIERGVKGSTKSMIKIEFMDAHYFYMTRRYKSEGFNNIKFSTILKNVIKENTNLPSIQVNDVDTNITYDNLVIPSNKSFAHFVYNREYIDGFSLVNDKACFNIFNHSDYINLLKSFSKAGKFTFTTNQEKENNPFLIKEYKFLMLDSFTLNSAIPNTIVSHFDYTDKGVNEVLILNDNISKNLATSEAPIVGNTMTVGFKRFEMHTKNFKDYINRLHSFKLLETYLLEITVSGNIMYNLYDIVSVNISNPIQGISNVNLLNSGNYVILKIVDKIEESFFNQVITLGRVGIQY